MIRVFVYILLAFMTVRIGINAMNKETNSDWFQDQMWKHRMVVISGEKSLVERQRERFFALNNDVLDRDLLVLTIIQPPLEDTSNGSAPNPHEIQKHFGIDPNRFEVILVGKDGRVKNRRTELIEPSEFFDRIDRMPMRQHELRSRR